MQQTTDEKLLVTLVLSGDQHAFARLVRQYERLILHIVTPLIENETDLEDICQDIFLKVYEKLGTFHFKSRLSTWIGNIAYNTAINFLQKKKNILLEDMLPRDTESDIKEHTVEQIIRDTEPDPEELVMEKQRTMSLLKAIDHLPVIQKTVLLLFHKQDLSLEEISGIVDMPVNTVKSHLYRARKSLKKSLQII